jgi:hypothetical protein
VRWNVVAGLLMIGAAAGVALDPDYAMPSPDGSSADPAAGLEAEAPPENVPLTVPEVEFRWQARAGLRCRVVLLDAELEQIALAEPTDGMRCQPTGAFRAALETGGRFHWLVVADDGSELRSAPRALVVRALR